MKKEPPMNGLHIVRFENGQMKEEKNYKDGKCLGKVRYWYENGQMKQEENVKDGKCLGKVRYWYENGQMRSESFYERAGIISWSNSWHENGKKKSTHTWSDGKPHSNPYSTGDWLPPSYDKERLEQVKKRRLERAKIYANQEIIEWYDNGQKKKERYYKDHEAYGNWFKWYKNGQKKEERSFKKGGKSNGKFIEWYGNGQKKEEQTYIDGKLNGKKILWYQDGQIIVEAQYKNGNLDGEIIWWHKNGHKAEEQNFKENKRHGEFLCWNFDGEHLATQIFKDGKLVSQDQLNPEIAIEFKDFDTEITLIKIIESRFYQTEKHQYKRQNFNSNYLFSYEVSSDIHNKIKQPQFSKDEEEQILSLIDLQERLRWVSSRNYGSDENITGSIFYEYLNEIGDRRWDNPLSLEEIVDQWERQDAIREDYDSIMWGADDEVPKVQKISKNKIKQFHDRFEKLNITFAGYDDRPSTSNEYKIINTWLYTLAEDIVEQWALKNNLDYHDYNNSNQYAPQDCRIDGVDVDVKTTTGIGRQHLKNFYRYKSEEDKAKNINEIIIGISSRTEKDWDQYLSDTSSSHVILGIFDPSTYSEINLELKYYKLDSNLLNACYFQSLEVYFKTSNILNVYSYRKYDPELIDYLVQESLKSFDSSLDVEDTKFIVPLYDTFSNIIFDSYRSFLPPAIYVLLDYPNRLGSYIESLLPKENYDLIPIIVELASKKKLQLFPHYFADYLLDKIINKERINEKEILPIIFSLIIVCDYQKVHALIYIKNLFKLAKILPNVRCKWHPNETMKDMSLDIIHNSYLPTVMAKCSHHPKHNTTIFTYSWKTGETLFYGQDDTKNCDLDDCGCLIHQPYGYEWYGRKNCKKYGQYSSYDG